MTTLPDAVRRLNDALETLAAALASGDAERVLDAEIPVASALSHLNAVPRDRSADLADLPRAIARARGALVRCRALSQSADELLRVAAGEDAYGPRGRHLSVPSGGRHLVSVT